MYLYLCVVILYTYNMYVLRTICMYVCMYIYIYMYIYTYTHIHDIYICTCMICKYIVANPCGTFIFIHTNQPSLCLWLLTPSQMARGKWSAVQFDLGFIAYMAAGRWAPYNWGMYFASVYQWNMDWCSGIAENPPEIQVVYLQTQWFPRLNYSRVRHGML